LIPMYFLIGVWGSGRKVMAAFKFILYSYFKAGSSYSDDDWLKLQHPFAQQYWLFLAFALAFAIKVPLFPLHTWLPDAHTEAPTAGSVILAGVLLKMGTYGFYRFAMPFYPEAVAYFTPVFMILSCIGIVYGSLVAMVQTDIKRLVAYSSVAHLGFVILGLFSLNQRGVEGAILQMINHGLSTGALFLLIGMLYDRRHTRLISDYGGIAKIVPLYTFFFIFVTVSSVGLPGLNNFIGEFMVLLGTFEANWIAAAVAVSGVILSVVYMLWMVERVFFGKVTHEANLSIKDLGWREVFVLAPLCIAMLWIGVYPNPLLMKIHASTEVFLKLVLR
ncbi:MAG: NADH-quinone oxidoreductase subunit M, partial [Deltaproteobacteria bacterium]|nr:NADH-quinone oxidoreductase subunit M [Deltaproteobacteria bacterium]